MYIRCVKLNLDVELYHYDNIVWLSLLYYVIISWFCHVIWHAVSFWMEVLSLISINLSLRNLVTYLPLDS